ncbi:hypothetical protein JTE90_019187 [Oedothorax gibbosus]|uniref:Dachshund n=1 Tax=Oedothorax gibbosus TaxID=931172 RepID=A0AAV6U7C4_9ARAC|nr:hypothetical protein JTE90_019187 [Oedothorax gibbosus]
MLTKILPITEVAASHYVVLRFLRHAPSNKSQILKRNLYASMQDLCDAQLLELYILAAVSYSEPRTPGRPPKRATMVGMNHNGASHGMLLKKSRMDGGEYYENGHIGGDRVDKSHLLANGYSHHVAAAQAAVAAATGGPHLNPLPFMALNHAAAAAAHHNSMMTSASLPLAATGGHPGTPGSQGLNSSSHGGHLSSSTPTSGGRGPAESSSVIKERNSHASDVINSTRLRDDRGDMVDSKDRLYGFDNHRMKDQAFLNGAQANGHSPVLNLSQHSSRPSNNNNNGGSGGPTTNGPSGGSSGGGGGTGGEHSGSENNYNDGVDDDDEEVDSEDDDDREQDLSDNPDVSSTANTDRLTSSQQQLVYPGVMGGEMGQLQGQTASSMETLLRNIQGLLKVAADNARQQERQISLEKAELKNELLGEESERDLQNTILDEQTDEE